MCVVFFCRENESSSVKVSFSEKNVSKRLKCCELLRKRDSLVKVNRPQRCHNPFSDCLLSYLFAANDFIREILFQRISTFVYTQLWSRFQNQISFCRLETLQNGEKSLDKLKAKQSQDQKRPRQKRMRLERGCETQVCIL